MENQLEDPTQDNVSWGTPKWATPKELEYRLLHAHCWLVAARNTALALGDTHTAGDINVLLDFLGHVRDGSGTKEHSTATLTST